MTISNVLELSTTDASNVDFKGVGIQGASSLANGDDAMRALGAILAAAVTRRVAKSGDATAAKTDHAQLWDFSAAATLSLTAAATLTTGWALYVRASGGAVTVDPNSTETIDGVTTIVIPAGQSALILCNGSAFYTVLAGINAPSTMQGRLTLSTGVAVPTGDVTGAGTVYFTPYNGNQIWLYTGSIWRPYALAEVSIALSGGTASKPHDVFIYDNSGTVTLELVAWTNDTTRATALTTQDAVYVKTGSTNKRYLGTIYLDGSKQCEDSLARRMVWNAYNRVMQPMAVVDTTDSWTYGTATWRQARATTTNQLEFVRGLDEDAVEALAIGFFTHASANTALIGIGLDSTTAVAANVLRSYISHTSGPASARYTARPGIGRHTLVWLEKGNGANTTTWFGDAGTDNGYSGIHGTMRA